MDRRSFLLSSVVSASLAATGGCIERELEEANREPPFVEDRVRPEEIDLPVGQRLAVAERAVERAAEAGIEDPDGLGSYLDEEGVAVERVGEAELHGVPVVELEYDPGDASDRGLMHHLGLAAGGFAALVAAGHDAESLEATIVDGAGRPFGEYRVERRWAEEYDAGEMTAREYANEVSVTAAATA